MTDPADEQTTMCGPELVKNACAHLKSEHAHNWHRNSRTHAQKIWNASRICVVLPVLAMVVGSSCSSGGGRSRVCCSSFTEKFTNDFTRRSTVSLSSFEAFSRLVIKSFPNHSVPSFARYEAPMWCFRTTLVASLSLSTFARHWSVRTWWRTALAVIPTSKGNLTTSNYLFGWPTKNRVWKVAKKRRKCQSVETQNTSPHVRKKKLGWRLYFLPLCQIFAFFSKFYFHCAFEKMFIEHNEEHTITNKTNKNRNIRK